MGIPKPVLDDAIAKAEIVHKGVSVMVRFLEASPEQTKAHGKLPLLKVLKAFIKNAEECIAALKHDGGNKKEMTKALKLIRKGSKLGHKVRSMI